MHEMNDKVKSQLTIQISIILKDDNEIHFGFGPYQCISDVFRSSCCLEQKLFCHKPGYDNDCDPSLNFFKDLFRIDRP